MTLKQFLAFAAIGAIVGTVVSGWEKWRDSNDTASEEQTGIHYQYLPDFSLPNLDGSPWRAVEWRNKVLVLNFWATWCPPCREEMPAFARLQEEFADQGVQFVAIAIDDREPVVDFIDTYGIEFPVLLGDTKAIELARRLGNHFGTLPYTVVARPGGEIVLRRPGEMDRAELLPLLQELTADL